MNIREFFNLAVIQGASKLGPLVSVFVYSAMMTPGEFGFLSVHYACLWLVASAISLSLHTGLGRLQYDPDVDRGVLLGTSLIALAVAFPLLGGVWILASPWLNGLIELPADILSLQALIAIGLVAEAAMLEVAIYKKSTAFMAQALILRSIAAIALSVLFVSIMSTQRFRGVIYADLITSLIFSGFAIRFSFAGAKWTFRWDYLRRLVRYSTPLIVYSASLTLLSQSDRIIISVVHDSAAAGIYSVGYLIGAVVLIASIPTLQLIKRRTYANFNAGAYEAVSEDNSNITGLLVLLTAFVSLWATYPLQQLIGQSYHDGLRIVPMIAVGAILQVFFIIWNRTLAFHEHTRSIAAIVVVSALLNIALNLLLLPRYGYSVAAVATTISQFAMAIGVTIALQVARLPKPTLSPRISLAFTLLALFASFDYRRSDSVGVPARLVLMVIVAILVMPSLVRLKRVVALTAREQR